MRGVSVIHLVVASAIGLSACNDDGGGGETSPFEPSNATPSTEPATSTGGTGGTETTGEPTGGAVTEDASGPQTTTDAVTSTTAPTTGGQACDESECAPGEHCDVVTDQCAPGCNEDADCPGGVCEADHGCAECLVDADCGLGTVCQAGACAAGCNDDQPCVDGLACCAGGCFDLLGDPAHCGSCEACPALDHVTAVCNDGMCGLGDCTGGFNNCDGDASNGCEVAGDCNCTPGEVVPCYTGPQGTADVGACKSGTQTCNVQGTDFGACEGEVQPNPEELCSNAIDDNCDGQTDEDVDEDGDGYTRCGGDCCDTVGPACLNPPLVNAGAFEVGGNMVDDDCDGMVDNPVAACDAGLPSNASDPLQYARAVDLCQTTSENAMGSGKTCGVISGALTRADGQNTADPASRATRNGFGSVIKPQKNNRLAVLSTGGAADVSDTNPGYLDFQIGYDNFYDSPAPADWLAANGNAFPNAPGCPAAVSNYANNSVQLKLRVRVPTNAKSFSVQMYFFSAEWPEWACSEYNDMFVTLVDSAAAGNPADKNIAIYTTPQNQKYPVGVNLAKAASGLFTQCKNGAIGCIYGGTNYNGCVGTGQLAGTGFDIVEGGCGDNNTTGGGTGWLKMNGNVKPGEIMEIRFTIWDTGDGSYDSLVLLDDWSWSVQASQPGVTPN